MHLRDLAVYIRPLDDPDFCWSGGDWGEHIPHRLSPLGGLHRHQRQSSGQGPRSVTLLCRPSHQNRLSHYHSKWNNK